MLTYTARLLWSIPEQNFSIKAALRFMQYVLVATYLQHVNQNYGTKSWIILVLHSALPYLAIKDLSGTRWPISLLSKSWCRKHSSCLLGKPFLMLKAEFRLDGHCWQTNKQFLISVESEIYTLGLLQVTFTSFNARKL